MRRVQQRPLFHRCLKAVWEIPTWPKVSTRKKPNAWTWKKHRNSWKENMQTHATCMPQHAHMPHTIYIHTHYHTHLAQTPYMRIYHAQHLYLSSKHTRVIYAHTLQNTSHIYTYIMSYKDPWCIQTICNHSWWKQFSHLQTVGFRKADRQCGEQVPISDGRTCCLWVPESSTFAPGVLQWMRLLIRSYGKQGEHPHLAYWVVGVRSIRAPEPVKATEREPRYVSCHNEGHRPWQVKTKFHKCPPDALKCFFIDTHKAQRP